MKNLIYMSVPLLLAACATPQNATELSSTECSQLIKSNTLDGTLADFTEFVKLHNEIELDGEFRILGDECRAKVLEASSTNNF